MSVAKLIEDLEYAVLARCQGHGSSTRINECRAALLGALGGAPVAEVQRHNTGRFGDLAIVKLLTNDVKDGDKLYLAAAPHPLVAPLLVLPESKQPDSAPKE